VRIMINIRHLIKKPTFLALICAMVILSLVFNCGKNDIGTSSSTTFKTHLYLLWSSEDMNTKMTVKFQTSKEVSNVSVYYDSVSRSGVSNQYRYHTQGNYIEIEGLSDRRIHTINLTNLMPGQEYFFVVGNETFGFSLEKKFKTLPSSYPIKFISGGDMSTTATTEKLLLLAAKQSPQFALIGGDIAYAEGSLGNISKWDAWLTLWEEKMRTPQGYLVPIIAAIGNHEINSDANSITDAQKAPYFLRFFSQDPNGKSFFVKKPNNSVAILVLDSGHLSPHSGTQRDWLANALALNSSIETKIAIYHVPLYPSFRDFNSPLSLAGRTYWLDLFDHYGLDLAFENHDHSFKRSKLLNANSIVTSNGTIYLGDGCFGVDPRTPGSQPWYLEKSSATSHFWLIELNHSTRTAKAIDSFGNVIDSLTF